MVLPKSVLRRLWGGVAAVIAYLFRLLPSLLVGVAGSLVASWLFLSYFQSNLTTLLIPVLLQGQDVQGSQFALGVIRAEGLAAHFGLDQIGQRKIRPRFLNEANDQVAREIERLRPRPALVVGPLQSSHALKLVPTLVADGFPIILGIPTSPSVTDSTRQAVWRLSPTDELQSKTVATTAQALRQDGKNWVLLYDAEDNKNYAEYLVNAISSNFDLQKGPRPLTIAVLRSQSNQIEATLRQLKPHVVIYAGMPPQARDLLQMAQRSGLVANWIFTDGCMLDRGLVKMASELRRKDAANRFFITFQAPPAVASPGLQQYLWYTQSIGGIVRGANSAENGCQPETAATSYEVFGFDSYIIALKLLELAAREDGAVDAQSVAHMMTKHRDISTPFLAMGPYRFDDKGDNDQLRFHVYEIDHGCVSHAEFASVQKEPQ
jgi:ABC-type branched-subunit amino acid transport system substrate-binding protein